jgi:hypothetical protein
LVGDQVADLKWPFPLPPAVDARRRSDLSAQSTRQLSPTQSIVDCVGSPME